MLKMHLETRILTGFFTREEIGRMSGEEFTKNEKMIMNQLKKWLNQIKL